MLTGKTEIIINQATLNRAVQLLLDVEFKDAPSVVNVKPDPRSGSYGATAYSVEVEEREPT